MSERWFCFVRAINTGSRRVSNAELVAALDGAGIADVSAYQAAGNLTFRAEGATAPAESDLSARLHDAFGFDCPVFLRSSAEVHDLVGRCPFGDADLEGTERRIQVTLLGAAPSAAQVESVAELVPQEDRVVIDGAAWWWLPVAGVSGSQLPVGRIERLLGPMTMRTLATVERFVAKFPD